ncbi:MAG: peptidoglycan-binding protein [Eubacteriales bacterium]|jgi:peptidoglycan hydrolase-like protein with peptidoglycan-binding domain
MNGNQELIDRGFLNVSVTSVRNSIPVAEATVSVSRNGRVIEELTTDSAGQTITVELGTPPIEYSQQPSEVKPYAEYTVTIDAPGYVHTVIDGVQLFPEQTAIQNVRMNIIPVQPSPAQITIDIQPNTLWGDFPPKIPEDEVKPLPDGGGLIVLPEPVIPEFMVVHLGVPDDTTAKNVWVPFKDYIANVASCEIYSTWPDQTIRANVLAIISFALNRVYTEWYRGRGYNFTITNSTAFDQFFDYGRNIYYNISNIVDEIFNTYITRPGIRQPLFTQFCDGARVRCNGMEQWGSKNLGEQGLDALSILRSFYGADVYLTQAEKVQGVPISYPGEPLQIGSSGYEVRTIQTQLNSISDHYPMIPKIRVDGVFGTQTQNAVRTFQQIFYLPVTGIVDLATWYKISGIYVAVNRLSEFG